MKFNLITQDYVSSELIAPPKVDIIEAGYLRLATMKGSRFTNPNFGSELYRLHRCKDTPQIRLQAVRWAKQALEPMKAIYFLTTIDVRENPIKVRGKLQLLISFIHQSGKHYSTSYTIKVAG